MADFELSTADAAASGLPAAAALLVQKRENRFVGDRSPWQNEVQPGEVALMPLRSGGAFDPLGCRSDDVNRADDLQAVTRHLKGRWAFVTLTTNRTLFLSPELAYERCQERVRKTLAALSDRGVWVCCAELQTKTGDGWFHWHAMVWVPDERPVEELRRIVERRWRLVTWDVNEDTGEARRSVESIGRIDVQDARSSGGAGTYCAKYLVKSWPAVAPWMLDSVKRFRKARFSGGFYDVLARMYRHERARGGRKPPSLVPRVRRTLGERMGSSGSRCAAFAVSDAGLKFLRTVNVPVTDMPEICEKFGGRLVKLGRWGSCRMAVAAEQIPIICEDEKWNASGSRSRAFFDEQCAKLRSAWHEYQWRRSREG